MIKKLWTGVLSGAALATLAATIFFSAAPAIASAAAPSPGDVYSAGTKELGGDVCSCPVMVGNCVCRVKGVEPIGGLEAE